MSLWRRITMWSMSLAYGTGAGFAMIGMIFRHGYREVFKTVQRERPKCLQLPELGTHGFVQSEDVKIHYVASGPEDKPLMLFVHGFPEFWYSWRHQIREFQKDYRVVAYDQRGYGESGRPEGLQAYNMVNLMKDVKNVIEGLGYKSCTLVGHDWGGAVTWAFGRLHPDMVDELIVMNAPPSPVFQKILNTSKKQLKMSWYMFLFQLPRLPEMLLSARDFDMFNKMFGEESLAEEEKDVKSEVVEAYKYAFGHPGSFTPPLNYYRAAFQTRPIKYDMDFSIPVLLIWGCKDMALSKEIPEEVQNSYPKIAVNYIEDGTHFVQMHKPKDVNQIMKDWLAIHGKSQAQTETESKL